MGTNAPAAARVVEDGATAAGASGGQALPGTKAPASASAAALYRPVAHGPVSGFTADLSRQATTRAGVCGGPSQVMVFLGAGWKACYAWYLPPLVRSDLTRVLHRDLSWYDALGHWRHHVDGGVSCACIAKPCVTVNIFSLGASHDCTCPGAQAVTVLSPTDCGNTAEMPDES